MLKETILLKRMGLFYASALNAIMLFGGSAPGRCHVNISCDIRYLHQMSRDILKIVGIVLMLLLTVDSIWVALNYVLKTLQMQSPLIPDYVVDELLFSHIVSFSITTLAIV